MRIGIAGLSHETNTFAVEKNDTMECVHVVQGEEVLAGAHPKGFIGGFIEAAQRPGVELVPAASIGFAHGGIAGARVFEQCLALIVEGLRQARPLDYASLPYRHLTRPIWPIDPDMEWEG